ELREKLKAREVSAREAAEAYLARIAEVEPRVHAYIAVLEEEARRGAEEADARMARGEDAPLLGVPLAIKDLLCMRGVATTCGSRILENFRAPYDATAVARLREAGAVFLGKANMDEFAMGSSTERSAFGPTHNPWDLATIPGGSSGGSAAAVAAEECAGALGSDTGGSIRQPAALCNVVGLKPTYGRVSRYGLVAFASSLDQIGPMTKDVYDCALLMNVIGGHDPRDSTSADIPLPDFTGHLEGGVRGLRLGVPKEYFIEGMDPEAEGGVRGAIGKLAELGAEAEEVSLPHSEYALAAYYVLAPSEASSNLARYDGARYGLRARGRPSAAEGPLVTMYKGSREAGFGEEVKRRIMLGTYALSSGYYDAYYLKALKVRTLVLRDFQRAFERVDLIVTPTSPTPAFRLGERLEDPLSMYLSDIFTIPCNLAGIPGLSVPCGFTRAGLPTGLQLLGRPFDEETLLRAAYAYEGATGHSRRRPPL
ncbi:MAG: Asp-tRNA(Asn)/Glu-tRNA(Gln) amidotransferase subunit GatA, partial [Nitrospinota bacterium]